MRSKHASLGLLVAVVVSLAACGGGSAGNAKADAAAARTVTSQFSKASVTVKKLTCTGPVPGVIDCVGKTTDGKVVDATLTAQGNAATCHGPLIADLAGKSIASVADVACH